MNTKWIIIISIIGTIFIFGGCALSGLPADLKVLGLVIFFVASVPISIIFGKLMHRAAENYKDVE